MVTKVWAVYDNCVQSLFVNKEEADKVYDSLVGKYKDKPVDLDDWVWMEELPLITAEEFFEEQRMEEMREEVL